MNELTIIASFEALPNRVEELKQRLLALARNAQHEHGCEMYLVHEDPENPTIVVLVEQWTSRDALDAHLALPDVASFREALPSFTAAAHDVRFLRPVSREN